VLGVLAALLHVDRAPHFPFVLILGTSLGIGSRMWVVEGELTLVTNSGEELLRAGDCAAFQRGAEDGHHLINKSARPARVLEIGNSDAQDRCVYSDIDMVAGPSSERYRQREGTPYPPKPG